MWVGLHQQDWICENHMDGATQEPLPKRKIRSITLGTLGNSGSWGDLFVKNQYASCESSPCTGCAPRGHNLAWYTKGHSISGEPMKAGVMKGLLLEGLVLKVFFRGGIPFGGFF